MKTEGKPSDNTNSPHKNSSEPRESKGKTNVSPSVKIDNRYPDLTVFFIMRVRRYSVNMSAHRYTLRTTRVMGCLNYYLFRTRTYSVTDGGGGKGGRDGQRERGEREREREREGGGGRGVTGRRMDDVDSYAARNTMNFGISASE